MANRTLLDAVGMIARTASAPALIRGTVDLISYPGVTTGVLPGTTERTANGTALQAAIDYANTNGKFLEAQPARLEYVATGTDNSRNVGLQVKAGARGLMGAGSTMTQFINYATNHPAVTLGPVDANANNLIERGYFGGFACGHGVDQTGQTSADGLLVGRIWDSSFDDIKVEATLGGSVNHAYVGCRIGLSTAQFFFQNRWGSLTVKSGQVHYMRVDSNGTGSRYSSIYLGGIGVGGGAGTFGSRNPLSSNALHINLPGLEFGMVDQLNVEWTSLPSGGGAISNASQAFVVGHLHLEGNQMNGFAPYLVHTVQGRTHILSVRFLDNWIAAANVTGTPRVFSAYSDSKVRVDQGSMRWNGSGYNAEAVASTGFILYAEDTSLIGRLAYVDVQQFELSGNTGAFSLDSTIAGTAPGTAGAIYGFEEYNYSRVRSTTLGAQIEARNADLTIYAAHKAPQIRLKQAITADRNVIVSDLIASAGPATRAPGDTISMVRESGATGAFNWLGKAADTTTTIVTLGTANTEASVTMNNARTWA